MQNAIIVVEDFLGDLEVVKAPSRQGSYRLCSQSPRYEQLTSSGHSSASAASRLVSTPSEPSSLTDPSPDRQGRTDM